MKIEVLGKGCSRCDMLTKLVKDTADAIGLDATIEKVTDMDRMLEMGVTSTPALAVDGVLVSQGKVPRRSDVEAWLRPGLTSGA
jgi:small redox-active disulfide protein 2